MPNEELKQKIKESGLRQWQVAAEIGVAEMTLIRWLRFPLSEEKELRITGVINRLKGAVVND